MKFEETPICKSRTNCFQCRNNEAFRSTMTKQYGEIECPENIPVGAALETLPQKSQKAHTRMIEIQENREKQLEKFDSIIKELYEISSEDGKKLIDDLKKIVYSGRKTPEVCEYCIKKIGEADQECCGGKIVKKPVYECTKHIVTVEKKCAKCEDFEID